MSLTSKQRSFLRKQAHDLEPLVRIGKDGSILEAINSREILKVKILQNCEKEKEEILEELSARDEFEVVGLIGRTIILYRENTDKPVISLEVKGIR